VSAVGGLHFWRGCGSRVDVARERIGLQECVGLTGEIMIDLHNESRSSFDMEMELERLAGTRDIVFVHCM